MTKVCILIDWSQSFTDKNGSFYSGASLNEKENACLLIEKCDKVINFVDVHSQTSKEFTINGGIYPIHNLVDDDLTLSPNENASARLTEKIQKKIEEKKLKSGVVIPNNVIYQTPEQPISIEAITKTFDKLPIIHSPEEYQYDYIISCKHFFNGTALQRIPQGNIVDEFTAASILQYQYGTGKGLTFYISGVVTGICVIHTAAGLKQMFPQSTIIIVKDACHPLIGEQFGISSEEQNDFIVCALCTQIGILYKSINTLTF
ncbi:hypothetical protein EHI8A_115340 [Entamoeba histolytica HM-1:IMSS-B]|uniref:Isochorismatase-like domain-containing protein n=6 Tax=Entamoeba histolytica TaxID=5759 RepID=C4M9C3_ENTH1|nr:hypothetical protein EHI_146360 [Entamoeba histolytica HM-1:IMSS]EMD49708.1 Hypothetical protein EHI5A_050310 [Entamoeba histolytica KU27]EMH77500.1 hypothetical protein EHI8A_115340 [Entamoeba histolytica HM-1:IMSS-B]EMS12314.1 hypothetical protein KM1_185690 [Entamoeba histolytica HM-3:IMSS]ENY65885.1 hypothetical protein EHI7A_107660 [Entamoeba histolytica HM-1:IMSS-A]GAT98258.1 hypothetical protein CL6EHI_146360 [Entamoeba histolytica]|eukprot:XP_649919.1 hypothetical protein EHI_146360 [Entamoeba histolytica HM-1:IMSS]